MYLQIFCNTIGLLSDMALKLTRFSFFQKKSIKRGWIISNLDIANKQTNTLGREPIKQQRLDLLTIYKCKSQVHVYMILFVVAGVPLLLYVAYSLALIIKDNYPICCTGKRLMVMLSSVNDICRYT